VLNGYEQRQFPVMEKPAFCFVIFYKLRRRSGGQNLFENPSVAL
jgi:hypothetical protein